MYVRIVLSAFHRFVLPLIFAMSIIGASQAASTIETAAQQAILIDLTTGTVLMEKNADVPMPPSSMSKIMTVYMVFERLKDGRLSLDDTFPVSEKAWRKKGSKMWVRVNTRVRVEDLIRGIIVQSGNDASIVAAEGIAGSEDAFAAEATQKAKEIGMEKTTYLNASGWPAEGHLTTARDLAKLAIRTIRDFPEYYHYYKEKTFTYNGIRQGNRNPTLYRNVGADGLKTGHTEAAGYGLAASAVRNGRRLVLVLNGLPSVKSRASESERLLDWGFREFHNYTLFKAGDVVTDAKVWMGEKQSVPLVIQKDITITIARKARRGMKVKVAFENPVPAPIKKGVNLAMLKIQIPDQPVMEFPLTAGDDVKRLGAFSRLGAAVQFILWGESG